MPQSVGREQLDTRQVCLVLTGGGARGAYQAGVVEGIARIAARRHCHSLPFKMLAGSSAGAINAAFLAATADQFIAAGPRLAHFWSNLHTHAVFRTDVLAFSRITMHWGSDLLFGGLKRHKGAQALLDATPLRRLLTEHIPFPRIASNLRSGCLESIEVTATDYANSENVSFFMSAEPRPGWILPRRRAVFANLGIDHVLASSAIPVLFPAVQIGSRHYGDGCLRNPAPLGSAIRLGGRRLVVVGVRHPKPMPANINNGSEGEDGAAQMRPTIGRVLSVVLNAILMDSTEFDIERLKRINEIIGAVPEQYRTGLPKQEIDFLYMQPSQDLGAFAADHFNKLPDMLRYLISGLGSREEASELISYLFFEAEYTRFLAKLGREDALRDRDRIEAMLFG